VAAAATSVEHASDTVRLVLPAGPDVIATVGALCAAETALTRVRRWRNEGTPLCAYLSEDGAVMLADPVLGGNAACEPPVAVTWHATERAISQDQSPTEDK
jgi:hypothetical protein